MTRSIRRGSNPGKKGRPFLPAGERRDVQFMFRMKPGEFQTIKGAAALDGVSVTEWVRTVVVSFAERRVAE